MKIGIKCVYENVFSFTFYAIFQEFYEGQSFSFFLSFFLYILPGARFRALSAGVHSGLQDESLHSQGRSGLPCEFDADLW